MVELRERGAMVVVWLDFGSAQGEDGEQMRPGNTDGPGGGATVMNL